MRGSLETQGKDEHSEKARCEECLSIATEITGPLEEGSMSEGDTAEFNSYEHLPQLLQMLDGE